jgi:hypothetical protein
MRAQVSRAGKFVFGIIRNLKKVSFLLSSFPAPQACVWLTFKFFLNDEFSMRNICDFYMVNFSLYGVGVRSK